MPPPEKGPWVAMQRASRYSERGRPRSNKQVKICICGSHQISRAPRRICLPMPGRPVRWRLGWSNTGTSGRHGVWGDGGSLHVRAELKKHHREAAIKATQMDADVQCTVLAEVPATRPSPDSGLSQAPSQFLALHLATTTYASGAARQPRKRRHGGRRAKRRHRALALAAARAVATSKVAPATRGGAPLQPRATGALTR
jgi:hypothetical protein